MTQVPSTSLPWDMEIGEKHCFHNGNRVSIFSGIPDRDYPNEISYQTIAEIWPGSNNCDIKDGKFIMMACHCHKELIAALETLSRVAVPYMSQAIQARNSEACQAVTKTNAAIAKAKNFKVETGG